MTEVECIVCGYMGWGRVLEQPAGRPQCRVLLLAWCAHADAKVVRLADGREADLVQADL